MNLNWAPDSTPDTYIQQLIDSWHKVLSNYEKTLGNDGIPYMFGERTNVGHLALAAFDTGAFPFIETISPFDEEEDPCLRQVKPDLELSVPGLDGTYWFEAKYLGPGRTRPLNPDSYADLALKYLDDATEQIQDPRWDDQDYVFGVAFAVIAIKEEHKTQYQEEDYRRLSKEMVAKKSGPDFSTVHFCPREVWLEGRHRCPGVMLIGSRVEKAG